MSSALTATRFHQQQHGVIQIQHILYFSLQKTTNNCKRTEPLQILAKSLSRTLTYHACNVTSPTQLTSVFEQAAAEGPFPLRGLVNCAGIGTVGESVDYPEDETKRTLDVNLAGSLYVSQAAAKVVRKQIAEGKNVEGLGASFVLIASMSGYISNKVSQTESSFTTCLVLVDNFIN
jgi:NAD(P)-dependent dehydrogenase (short-subunit alcohol dehydrogenase family)